MQCPYCGRDIPDDARWCPYCGGEQTPPEDDLQNENPPAGRISRMHPAPPDDWKRGAFRLPAGRTAPPPTTGTMKPSRRTIPGQTTRPCPAGRTMRRMSPRRRTRDAPRSKALLIAIFAALGVALIVLLIALNVKPKPKDPVVAATPAVTATAEPSAAPTPTPTPDPDAEPHADAFRRQLHPAGERCTPAHAGGRGEPHVGAVLPCPQRDFCAPRPHLPDAADRGLFRGAELVSRHGARRIVR